MAQIVERKKLSDGAIAVRFRPDGADELHDAWHTFYVQPSTTTGDIETWVNGKKSEVDSQYQAISKADDLLSQLT